MKVIFTCGGTAGHVNPALALAGYMQKQDPQVQVLFVGTPDGMERDLVEKAGYAFRTTHIDDQLRRTAGGLPGLLHRLRPGAAGRQGGVGQVQAEARQPHVQQFRQQVRPAAGGAKGGVGFHGVSSL